LDHVCIAKPGGNTDVGIEMRENNVLTKKMEEDVL
jgi:hypothetical protein